MLRKIMLHLGLGISRINGASVQSGSGVTATFVVTQPTIVPTLDSAFFKLVLSETRLVDTSFTLSMPGFDIATNPLVITAGNLESAETGVSTPAADDGNYEMTGTDDAAQVTVLNTGQFTVLNP